MREALPAPLAAAAPPAPSGKLVGSATVTGDVIPPRKLPSTLLPAFKTSGAGHKQRVCTCGAEGHGR